MFFHCFNAPRKSRALVMIVLLSILVCTVAPSTRAYSVLAHEAIIDSAWDSVIKPQMQQRFPAATPDELKNAHAYAYGGAIIQDMGYYPFGNKFFSDLTHYVRSGDFVAALIRDSADLNEYAFALGALSHYCADNDGHSIAVNRAVPILYPNLQRKFGNVVAYDQNPSDHLKTEFGFDVVQVAQGHYAPDAYHDHIGFEVSNELLARAFRETYSLEVTSLFSDYDLAISSFRHDVSSLIPKATVMAWQMKKDEIQKDEPGITRQQFIYNISRSSYRKNWSNRYEEPGFGSRFLAFLIRLIPKIGPLRTLAFRPPTPATEKLFMDSFNQTIKDYNEIMGKTDGSNSLGPGSAATAQTLIKNDNFDIGSVTGPGDYPLADKTYADLVTKLGQNHFAQVSPELRTILLSYFSDLNAPFATKKNKQQWDTLAKEIEELRAVPPTAPIP
jgi:hypothetical protein